MDARDVEIRGQGNGKYLRNKHRRSLMAKYPFREWLSEEKRTAERSHDAAMVRLIDRWYGRKVGA